MITYLVGDATRPQSDGNKIIAHVCNNIGAWGKGFVLAISKRWRSPETMYKGWYAGAMRTDHDEKFGLGNIQIVRAEQGIWVANMVAQDGIYAKKGIPPIRYEFVEECLSKLAMKSIDMSASVHMPRIGCGLAGGSWDKIEEIINRTLVRNNINVFVYDLKK